MYRQSDGSLAIVDIDASKGFVDLWVNFFVAIEDIHQNGYQGKMCFFGLINFSSFPLRWACFPIKIGQNAHLEHFSMYFDDFIYHLPYFLV